MATAKGFGDVDLARVRLRGQRMDMRVEEAVTEADLERTIDGATSLTMMLRDPERDIIGSKTFSGRVALSLDDLAFELSRMSKNEDTLTLTFESKVVAKLRRERGLLVAKRGTTTRTAFAQRLVKKVPGAKFKGEEGVGNKTKLARAKGENSWDALGRLAADRNWRRFESEGTVFFGGDDWLAKLVDPVKLREYRDGVESINFDVSGVRRADRASLTVVANRWQSRPGVPALLPGLSDLTDGPWIVETIGRSLFSKLASVQLTRKAKEFPEPKPAPVRHDESGVRGSGGGRSSGGAVVGGWTWPVRGRSITSPYGQRSGGMHYGIDIDGVRGEPIYASRAGTVTFAGVASGYGNVIYISHDGGMETRYAHLLGFDVHAGQRVDAGAKIGSMDSTGNSTGDHLHFEIRIGGGAVDPMRYLP